MQPRALRTLLTIADCGSFMAAAELCHMTLSAVSMQMKSLESELGVKLFDRSFRPPMLTPIGRQVVAQAKPIIDSHDRLVSLCSSNATLNGRYKVGFIFTAGVRILPGFLDRCRRLAPDAQFDVETGLSDDLQDKVAHGQLDMALITRSDLDHPALSYSGLAFEEIVYALPERCQGHSIDECMASLPFLQFMPHTGIGKLIFNHLSVHQHHPQRTIVLDSVEAIVACVNSGIGFTALPKPDVERYSNTALSIRPMSDPPLIRELSIVTYLDGCSYNQLDQLKTLFPV